MGVSVELEDALRGGVPDDVGEARQPGRLRQQPLPQHRQVDVVGLGCRAGIVGLLVVEM